MKVNRLFITIVILLVSLSCKKDSSQTVSFNDYGVVIHFRGKAFKVSNGNKTQLKFRERIRKGDTVITKKDSSVIIQILDLGLIRIAEKSKFELKAISSNNLNGTLIKGHFGGKFKKLKKKRNVNIKGPNIAAAIRGTLYGVESANKNKSTVSVLEGSVAVTVNATSEEILLTKNQAIDVVGKKPSKIRAIKPVEGKRLSILQPAEMVPEIETLSDEDAAKIFDEFAARENVSKKPKKKVFNNLQEMKQEYKELDEITLFSNQVLTGKIVKQNTTHIFLQVPGGAVKKIKKTDIAGRKTLQ